MVKRSDSVRDLTDLQLKCHLYRHNFAEPDIYLEHYSRDHPTGNRDGWVMVHVCDCGVQRFDYVEPETYELWDRKYWYTKADGYLVSFPATTQDYRAEVIRRRHSRKA